VSKIKEDEATSKAQDEA
jgi:hypothetical protein